MSTILKISFVTFGCKVNTSEDESLSAHLKDKGFEITEPQEADIVVINTCAVTETAAKRCKSYISSLRRKKPNLKIIATGCLATDIHADLKKAGADLIVTNGSKGNMVKHILEMSDGLKDVANAPFYGGGSLQRVSKTRAFFKIQDGCSRYCSYCIIPSLRGHPRSIKEEDAIEGFKNSVKAGFKEIVLVGIHIGMYGIDTGTNLAELLKKLIKTEGDYRIRLSSLEPNELTDEIIDIMVQSKGKICPHLHIPLQSGSDKILTAMGRRYLSHDYITACRKAKSKIKDLVIGSDVIVGFPQESPEDFQDTVNTLKLAGADFIHVFPYSDRQGTKASLMDGKLTKEKKEDRATTLRNMWKEVSAKTMEQFIGKKLRVLIEKNNKCHSENYLPVVFTGKGEQNTFAYAEITEYKDGKLIGLLC